ncbi:MAG: hypothetical protein HRT74_06850, partial [Flavobacteriales bacterium]|nr:hypothetical protein [Flavobacteriales bacterium]
KVLGDEGASHRTKYFRYLVFKILFLIFAFFGIYFYISSFFEFFQLAESGMLDESAARGIPMEFAQLFVFLAVYMLGLLGHLIFAIICWVHSSRAFAALEEKLRDVENEPASTSAVTSYTLLQVFFAIGMWIIIPKIHRAQARIEEGWLEKDQELSTPLQD